MAFDIAGARAAGYSEDEIAEHLASSRGFDYGGAVKAGYSPEEIVAHLSESPAETKTPATPTERSWGEAVASGVVHIPSSAIEVGRNVASAIRHPIDTVTALPEAFKTVAKIGAGGLQKLTKSAGITPPSEKYIPNFESSYISSGAKFKEKVATDPVGLALDATTVAGAGGVAAKSAGASKIGTALQRVAAAVEPSGLPATVVRATGKILPGAASKVMQFAMKPGTALSPKQRRAVLDTALREDIPLTEKGYDKLVSTRNEVESNVRKILASDPTKTISTASALKRVDELVAKFKNTDNAQALLDELRGYKKRIISEHGKTMSVEKAQEMKKNLYQQTSSFYGKSSITDETKAIKQAFARGLKEEIEAIFPDVKPLNARDGHLIKLQDVLGRSIGRIGNREPLGGIATPLSVGAGEAVAGTPGAILGLLSRVVQQPKNASRLALSLSKGQKGLVFSRPSRRRAILPGLYQAGRIQEQEQQ